MNERAPIGQILAEMGVVTDEARAEAARQAPASPARFASRLLRANAAPAADLVRGLAAQKGVPGIDLSQSVIDLAVLDLVPREIAQDANFLPVGMDDERIHLAMLNPDDTQLQSEVQFVTGKSVVPHVALQTALQAAIPAAYDAREAGGALWRGDDASASAAHLEVVVPGAEDADLEDEEVELVSVTVDLEDEPIELEVDVEEFLAPTPETGEPEGRRILAVDDEEEIRNLVSTALVREGYRVETASRGLEALQKVKTFNPELVILDAMLPEVHGFEICRKIRSSKRFGHVPVLMISAVYRGWRYAQDVKEVYGASDFMEKPFRISEMIRRVHAALDGRAPEPEEPPEAAQAKASAAYKNGVGLLKAGKVDGAIEAFNEGLAADPFAASLHFSLGRALQVKKDVYGAMSAYERAVELKPDLFPALRSLATLYEKKGFRRKAIETWERALPVATDGESKTLARDNLLRLLEAPPPAVAGGSGSTGGA